MGIKVQNTNWGEMNMQPLTISILSEDLIWKPAPDFIPKSALQASSFPVKQGMHLHML